MPIPRLWLQDTSGGLLPQSPALPRTSRLLLVSFHRAGAVLFWAASLPAGAQAQAPPPPMPPPQPKELAFCTDPVSGPRPVAEANAQSITLRWTEVPGAVGYALYRSASKDQPFAVVWQSGGTLQAAPGAVPVAPSRAGRAAGPAAAAPGSPTSHTDTGLLPSTFYCYRVAALSAAGQPLSWTPQTSATTGPPPTVSGLRVEAIRLLWKGQGWAKEPAGHEVVLAWDSVSPSPDRYEVSGPGKSGTVSRDPSGRAVTTFTFSFDPEKEKGPSPGPADYRVSTVYVVPLKNGGTQTIRGAATVSVTIPPTVDPRPPGPAPALAATGGTRSITLTWAELAEAGQYRIQRSMSAADIDAPVRRIDSLAPSGTAGTTRSYVDKGHQIFAGSDRGLLPGTAYYYRVQARYADKAPAMSPVVSATPTPPQPVTGLAATPYDVGIKLRWNGSGADAYRISRGIRRVMTSVKTTSDTTYDDKSLLPGTYTYAVEPVYGTGDWAVTGPKAEVTATLASLVPTIVVNVPFTDLNKGYKIFDRQCTVCHTFVEPKVCTRWVKGTGSPTQGWWNGKAETCYEWGNPPPPDASGSRHYLDQYINAGAVEMNAKAPLDIHPYGGQHGIPVRRDALLNYLDMRIRGTDHTTGRPTLCCRPAGVAYGSGGPETRLLTEPEIELVANYIVDEMFIEVRPHQNSTASPPDELFTKNCAACHSARSFATRNLSGQQVKDAVLQGRPPRMASFAGRFEASALDALAEYVAQLSKAQP
ncbi:MAG TPA: cytochrome c [Gemmatimonadales bacterium]|nr:cytochrome c [Gemmatimonadales bacterium]